MTETSAQEPSARPRAATVADVMRPPVTTLEQDDHAAAAAYLMKRSGATALVVLGDEDTNQLIGLITEADIVKAVADGKDLNELRIHDLMTRHPTVIGAATGIREAAESMMKGHFRTHQSSDDLPGMFRRHLTTS